MIHVRLQNAVIHVPSWCWLLIRRLIRSSSALSSLPTSVLLLPFTFPYSPSLSPDGRAATSAPTESPRYCLCSPAAPAAAACRGCRRPGVRGPTRCVQRHATRRAPATQRPALDERRAAVRKGGRHGGQPRHGHVRGATRRHVWRTWGERQGCGRQRRKGEGRAGGRSGPIQVPGGGSAAATAAACW